VTLLSSTQTIGSYTYIEGSHESTRPATSNWGQTITPGNNTWGTAAQVGSDVAEDLWAIEFTFTNVGVSNNSKSALVQVGFDFAGGTTFPASPDRYNSITLVASNAISYQSGFGCQYWFPLGIPAGTAILMRGTTENATVGTIACNWTGWGRPKYPEATRRGAYVESLGVVEASSRGTVITPGTTSDGSPTTSLGTLAADHPCWYWEFGFGVHNDTTQGNNAVHCDLLNASTGEILLQNGRAFTTSGEAAGKQASLCRMPFHDVAGGTEIFGRAQTSGTLDATYHMTAYGVGG
jgi:hypothetical protein